MISILLIAELVGLYLLSRTLTKKLFLFLLAIFRHRSVAVSVITIVLFPGTIVHELSHLFTAEILGVRTGKLTLVPESIEGEDIKTGSVSIAQTDPFRRYAIGLAPVIWGLIVLTSLSYLAFGQYSWLTIIYFYFMFAVSNSMFSSSEDLKGIVPFALTLGALVTAAYFAGLRFMLTGGALELTNRVFWFLVQSMGIVLAINILLLLTLQILIDLMGKTKYA